MKRMMPSPQIKDPRATIILAADSRAMRAIHEIVEERLQDETEEDRAELRERTFQDYLCDRIAEHCLVFFDKLNAAFNDGDFEGTYRPDAEDTAGFDASFVPFFYDHRTQLEAGLRKQEDGSFQVGVGFTDRWFGEPAQLNEEEAEFRAARRREMAEGLMIYLAWQCEKDGHGCSNRRGDPVSHGDDPELLALESFSESFSEGYWRWETYGLDADDVGAKPV